jgi:aminopeptidase N
MKSASKLIQFATNPNTANYDIKHQKLEFTVNPEVHYIAGKVTTTFEALNTMNSIVFDLTNELTVTSCKIGNTNLVFNQDSNNELEIIFPNTIPTGTISTVEVIYAGEPAITEDAFTQTFHNGSPIIWTLSEPYGAKDWWPCKQDLNDKIDTIDIHITAPNQYISVANGLEISSTVNGANKTTHFKHNYPIPAYLVAIAVSNYQIFNQTAGSEPNTFPIVNYLYPETFTAASNALSVTLPIMNFFESKFEPYPFRNEKYGHAQCSFGGGMEHSTVSFMGSFGRDLIAHELAHQWFGNKITCGTWKDIWLNEGFATFLTTLAIEHLSGETAFINEKADMINHITYLPDGNLYLTDSQLNSVSRIFSSRLSYDKGAMVLEMLRFKLGDTVFYEAIRNYLSDPQLAFGYAVTENLKQHLENVYQQSLTEFFNDWVYNQGHPTYSISAENTATGYAKITISQTQSHPSVTYFEMPVPIRLIGANNQIRDIILENAYNEQEFIIEVPFEFNNIVFDPKKNIISRNSTATLTTKSNNFLDNISLYPNPTSNEINIIKNEDILIENVTIYNNLGQIISNVKSDIISLNGFSNGIYTIKINTNNGIIFKKIIKR